MARGRRSACDSVSSSRKAFQVIKNDINPAHTLSDQGVTYFHQIINSRERSTWNDIDIEAATRLAKTICQIDEAYQEIDEKGFTDFNCRGEEKRSATAQQLDRLYQLESRLVRRLGLASEQRGITGSKQAKRNEADVEAQSLNQKADDSGGILA